MDPRVAWFERLFDTYGDAIFRHLYLRLGDRERAKELSQEVFMKTWQYIILGKTITHEKAFLYTIAQRLFINEIRTDKRTYSLDSLERTGYEVEDRAPTPATLAEGTELIDRIATLKDTYRDVLIMRYLDDLPIQEIAELLGETEGTVSMRLKRALDALRATYHSPNQTLT